MPALLNPNPITPDPGAKFQPGRAVLDLDELAMNIEAESGAVAVTGTEPASVH